MTKEQNPTGMILLERSLAGATLGFYLKLPEEEKLRVKADIWETITSTVDLEKIPDRAWNEVPLATDEHGHMEEEKIAKLLEGFVQKYLQPREKDSTMSIVARPTPPEPDGTVYNYHRQKIVCCRHVYELRKDERPWIVPSKLVPEITMPMTIALKWESDMV